MPRSVVVVAGTVVEVVAGTVLVVAGTVVVVAGTVVVVVVDLTALSELPPQAERKTSKQKKRVIFAGAKFRYEYQHSVLLRKRC